MQVYTDLVNIHNQGPVKNVHTGYALNNLRKIRLIRIRFSIAIGFAFKRYRARSGKKIQTGSNYFYPAKSRPGILYPRDPPSPKISEPTHDYDVKITYFRSKSGRGKGGSRGYKNIFTARTAKLELDNYESKSRGDPGSGLIVCTRPTPPRCHKNCPARDLTL